MESEEKVSEEEEERQSLLMYPHLHDIVVLHVVHLADASFRLVKRSQTLDRRCTRSNSVALYLHYTLLPPRVV